MYTSIIVALLSPLVYSHQDGRQQFKPPYTIGSITIPLTDFSRLDPFSPEKRPRELMLTITYPSLTQIQNASSYPITPYFPPKTRALMEGTFFLPEGFLSTLNTLARDNLPFISTSSPRTSKLRVVGSIPGYGGSRLLSQNLTQHLTQTHGFITLSTESPFEADVVEYPDGRLALNQFPNINFTNETVDRLVDARVRDWEFILTKLPTEAIMGRIPGCQGKDALRRCRSFVETKKVGLFGHSLGGYTVGTLATRLRTRGRLSGIVNMDGGFTEDVTGVKSPGVLVPFLNMARDGREGDMEWSLVKEKAKRRKISNGELEVKGSGHNSFTDLPGLAAQLGLEKLLPKQILEVQFGNGDLATQNLVVRTYLSEFFKWSFGREKKGRKQPLGLLDGIVDNFPEVRWRVLSWYFGGYHRCVLFCY